MYSIQKMVITDLEIINRIIYLCEYVSKSHYCNISSPKLLLTRLSTFQILHCISCDA